MPVKTLLENEVEVGQVWKFIDKPNVLSAEFEVIVVADGNVYCKNYYLSFTWDGTLSDFLAKFERVS